MWACRQINGRIVKMGSLAKSNFPSKACFELIKQKKGLLISESALQPLHQKFTCLFTLQYTLDWGTFNLNQAYNLNAI